MSFFAHLFDKLKHDAAPLLKAAAQWAETEGLGIAKEVEAELAAKAPAALVPLFNEFVAPSLGLELPVGATLTAAALGLLKREMAKAKASDGATLRASVLNAGVEQAALLLKGEQGDTQVAASPRAA